MLQHLYEIVKDYENVYIVTSCRASDKKAFIKLGAMFSINHMKLKNYNKWGIFKDYREIPNNKANV